MSLYSAYCNGYFNNENSAIAYLIFKDGQFLEEQVIKNDNPGSVLRQQTLALKVLIERLVKLKAENIIINFSFKEAHDRVMKAYTKYQIKKDPIPRGYENSNAFFVAKNLKSFKSFKWDIIPLKDNLRSYFLSRKFKVENWEHRDFYWKGELPISN